MLFWCSTLSWIVCSLFGYILQLLLDLCLNRCVRWYNSLIKEWLTEMHNKHNEQCILHIELVDSLLQKRCDLGIKGPLSLNIMINSSPFNFWTCSTFSFLFPAGPEPFLHLPVIQCGLVECWWVLLLCCGHRYHVSHLHSYLSVHYQKGEFHNGLAPLHVRYYIQRLNRTSRVMSFSSNTLCSMTWWQLTVLSVSLYAEPMMVCLGFFFFSLLKDGSYRVLFKYTLVTLISCSIACCSNIA